MEDDNFAIMQYWEISDVEFGIMSNGCSLHIDMISHSNYVSSVYTGRDEATIDPVYNRTVGGPIIITTNDEIFERLAKQHCLILEEVELNNLVNYEDLILT